MDFDAHADIEFDGQPGGPQRSVGGDETLAPRPDHATKREELVAVDEEHHGLVDFLQQTARLLEILHGELLLLRLPFIDEIGRAHV